MVPGPSEDGTFVPCPSTLSLPFNNAAKFPRNMSKHKQSQLISVSRRYGDNQEQIFFDESMKRAVARRISRPDGVASFFKSVAE